MKIGLIFIENFPKDLRDELNDTSIKSYCFEIFDVKDDISAFEQLNQNIEANKLYNVILSGHDNVKDAYGLLKSFIDYNIEKDYIIDSSNCPFFLFLEKEKLDKKKLYARFITEEKVRKDFNEEFNIDSKSILFSRMSCNVQQTLMKVVNYYYRKNIDINRSYNSPYIKIMFTGTTGTGKSTIINQCNGEKVAYSSSENQLKTKIKDTFVINNKKYPILFQDTEGFEIGETAQIEKVYENINENTGSNINKRLHIVINLIKDNRGLDKNDIPILVKLHKLKILYYILYPRQEKMEQIFRKKANRLIKTFIEKLENNDSETIKLFKEDKNEIISVLNDINKNIEGKIFSGNSLKPHSEGIISLLEQIKLDLFKIKKVHSKYIELVENMEKKSEKLEIGISGDIKSNDEKNIIKFLDDSPFFYKYSADDIKKSEAEKLLGDCDVSVLWLFFYNSRVEKLRKELLEKIKKIYYEVKIDAEVDTSIFSNKESWFYKTDCTKDFIKNLIHFFSSKYMNLEESKKYYSACKDYNRSIDEFVKYVESYKRINIDGEPVRYDIDFT